LNLTKPLKIRVQKYVLFDLLIWGEIDLSRSLFTTNSYTHTHTHRTDQKLVETLLFLMFLKEVSYAHQASRHLFDKTSTFIRKECVKLIQNDSKDLYC